MGLVLRDISHAWVASLCRDLAASDDVKLVSFQLTELATGQGVISRYQPSSSSAIVGHRVLTIHWLAGRERRETRVLIKSKVPGAVIRSRLEEVYRRFDPRLADFQAAVSPSILDDCHTRELRIYKVDRPSLRAIMPAIHRVWADAASQIFVVVMELLENVRHDDTLNDLDVWQTQDIAAVLAQIARVHGDFLGEISATSPPPWLLPFDRLNNAALRAYEAELVRYNAEAFPDLFDAARVNRLEALLSSSTARHHAIVSRPLTLVHGDLTPRNLCLTRGENLLRAYDWELAQAHLPQRDVCELLCYLLDPRRGWRDDDTTRLLDSYRTQLQRTADTPISAADFRHDLALALAEFCTFKLLVQGITHQLLGNRYYFARLVHNAFDGLEAFGEEPFA